MLCKNFKIDGIDYTEYAHKNGLTITYAPVYGLPEKMTLDGVTHDDVIKNKATYTIRMNPVKPDIAREILQAYKQPKVYLTIYDVSEGVDKTILCRTGAATSSDPFVKQGEAAYWKLSDLTFREV